MFHSHSSVMKAKFRQVPGMACCLLLLLLLLLLLTQSRWCSRPTPSATVRAPFSAVPCARTIQYQPSDLEQAWLSNVATWEPSFCSILEQMNNSTTVWLDTMSKISQMQYQQPHGHLTSPSQLLADEQKMDSRVFSHFRTTFQCGPSTTEQITWIEPLSHGLRHPNALCNLGADIMDRTYLMLAHAAESRRSAQLGNLHCVNRTCQKLYFDLGATTLKATADEAGQGWFFDAYRRQGISFDRYFLWEARPVPQSEIFANLPKADLHKYQYYNIPAATDITDRSNPVNILKDVAQLGDFVAFKLDIDNFAAEHAILQALLDDAEALALIDEFFFEEHVNFKEMLQYWGPGPAGSSLATSYALFLKLRQLGVRAHSWV